MPSTYGALQSCLPVRVDAADQPCLIDLASVPPTHQVSFLRQARADHQKLGKLFVTVSRGFKLPKRSFWSGKAVLKTGNAASDTVLPVYAVVICLRSSEDALLRLDVSCIAKRNMRLVQ